MGILTWWRARFGRSAELRASAARYETAARVLDGMAEMEAAHAAKLPDGPERVGVRMQQAIYAAEADMYRARAGGDHEGAVLHEAEAKHWRRKLDAHIGNQAAGVVHLDTHRVTRMREAGL